MIIQKKPDYLIFAESAKKGENIDFPDVSRGWGVTIDQTASKPPMEWMNGAFNRIDKNMLYLLQQGVPEWSELVRYPVNAIIKYNGVLYIALTENDNIKPSIGPTKWAKLIDDASLAKKGLVQLSSATNSTSESHAATSLAVKKLYDKVETKFSKSGGLLGGSVKIDGELELNRNPCALIFSTSENNKKMILKNNSSDSFVMSYYDEKYWYDFFRFTAESKIVDFKHVNNVTIGNKSVLKKGDYGIGTQGMVVDSTNRQLGSAFIAIAANNDDKPEINGGVCGFQSFSTNNGYGMQLVSTNNAEAPLKIFARAVENDKKVGEWVEILKKGDRGLFLHVQSCTKIDSLFQVTTMLSGERLFVKAENTKILPTTAPGYLLKMGARDVGGGGFYLFCEYMENGAIWKGTNQAMDQPITWNMLMTDQSIKSHLNSYSPVGIPQPWPSETPPAGWLKCDGSVFDKNKYPLLAKAYPSGKLPDLRGEFIRGWNDGGKVDIGREILSLQSDAIRNIKGEFPLIDRFRSKEIAGSFYRTEKTWNTELKHGSGDDWGVMLDFDASRCVPVANENRPRNIAFLYIVKAA